MVNRHSFLFLIGLMTILFWGCVQKKDGYQPIDLVIENALKFSVKQSLLMANSLKDIPDVLPKTIDRNGKLETCHADWWVSGFFPGQLWYLYEYSKDEKLKEWAIEFSNRVESQKFNTSTHDLGFIIHCSFGNGYRITHNEAYLDVLKTAAQSLSTRYNPKIGSIRSWDYTSWSSKWQYPVIIDNMMNLEMLTWSAKKFDIAEFRSIAINHANNTLKNHYRLDYSCYHVISYDTLTGNVEKKNTAQGFSDESAWARGQAWGLYGFTMMFRETGDKNYLEQARHIASFLINHPRMPKDKIPYWDFDCPDIPNTYRDASAAAIICSALIELSQYVGIEESKLFLHTAETQIRTLSAPPYLNKPGAKGNFILGHSIGHVPNGAEIDVPLTYTDYYYVEALLRYKKILERKN